MLKPGCVCMGRSSASQSWVEIAWAQQFRLSAARAGGVSYVCVRKGIETGLGSACRWCPHTCVTKVENAGRGGRGGGHPSVWERGMASQDSMSCMSTKLVMRQGHLRYWPLDAGVSAAGTRNPSGEGWACWACWASMCSCTAQRGSPVHGLHGQRPHRSVGTWYSGVLRGRVRHDSGVAGLVRGVRAGNRIE